MNIYAGYVYKIRWLFNNSKGGRKNCINVIKAIGAKTLTKINFLTSNRKRVYSYTGMHSEPFGAAESETIKNLRRYCRDKNVWYVELLRQN